jgi:uncharacterized membrane protein YqhA
MRPDQALDIDRPAGHRLMLAFLGCQPGPLAQARKFVLMIGRGHVCGMLRLARLNGAIGGLDTAQVLLSRLVGQQPDGAPVDSDAFVERGRLQKQGVERSLHLWRLIAPLAWGGGVAILARWADDRAVPRLMTGSDMPEERESVTEDTEPPRYARRSSARAEQALVGSLWLAYIPVAFLLLAALGAFVYGMAVFINAFSGIVHHPFPVGHHIGLFLLDFDLFLIGATALISAIGFYELFIADIDRRQAGLLPRWLAINDLNDLKARVVSMVVLVLAVAFTEEAVDSPDGLYILEFGGAVTLVIVALTVFVRLSSHADYRDLSRAGRAGGPSAGDRGGLVDDQPPVAVLAGPHGAGGIAQLMKLAGPVHPGDHHAENHSGPVRHDDLVLRVLDRLVGERAVADPLQVAGLGVAAAGGVAVDQPVGQQAAEGLDVARDHGRVALDLQGVDLVGDAAGVVGHQKPPGAETPSFRAGRSAGYGRRR